MKNYSKKYDKEAYIENKKAEMEKITNDLEKGVADLLDSAEYKRFLDTMAKFPHYSVNNNILILMQKPDATMCQSFNAWKKMGRSVKKGEKGLTILAPASFTVHYEVDKKDENGNIIYGADGQPEKEEKEGTRVSFKTVKTFDISQTEGEPIPAIGVNELTGNVEDYEKFYRALVSACPVPVEKEGIQNGAKGYFDHTSNRIVIKDDMSEVQTIKTLIHEMAHQRLHSHGAAEADKSRDIKEVEAESIAYTVCAHFGIDTGDYSFSYVAGWGDKDMKDFKASLDMIKTCSSDMIDIIEGKIKELEKPENRLYIMREDREDDTDIYPTTEELLGEEYYGAYGDYEE